MTAEIFTYWGKARGSRDDGPDWHPLVFHSLDVAASAEALLDANPQLLQAIARLLRLPAQRCRPLLLAAAALHDLGKFTGPFQKKSKLPLPPAERGRERLQADIGHAKTGAWLWDDWYDEGDVPGGKGFWWMVAAAAGHHGEPPGLDDKADNCWDKPNRAAALTFAWAVLDLFALRQPLIEVPPLVSKDSKTASWLVAGLVNLADWVGSDREYFPYRSPEVYPDDLVAALACYWQETAQPAAKKAVAGKGLRAARPARDFSLADILGDAVQPTPLQDWAASVPLGAPGPRLALIEDFTGAGKTEAALLLAQRLMAAGHAGGGLYWALPTQATSNALYGRISKCYHTLFAAGVRPSLALLHGDSGLHLPFRKSVRPDEAFLAPYLEAKDGQAEEAGAEAVCAAWLQDDRRTGFFAEMAVGTVDQALLAILPTRFNVLRLLGLSQRVLVVDEVHSYDSYTGPLLQRLIAFQAALGGSTLLLSATLGSAARRSLVEAFAEGLGQSAPDLAERGFPNATLIGPEGADERVLAQGRGTRRDLPVERLATPEVAEAALLDLARAGGCGAYIRNTVDDAIESCRRLRAKHPGVTVDLFHARFALADRKAREDEVLAAYGKISSPERRAGRILIATQVVEQSLDLDFDLLASDLAPLDLLIQRAGRLQRHAERSGRPTPPRLLLVAPDPYGEIKPDWLSCLLPKAAYVYPNHARLWVAARNLVEAGRLPLASCNPRDLLDAVYDFREEDLPAALEDAREKIENAIEPLRRAHAKGNALEVGAGYSSAQTPGWQKEVYYNTRYSELEDRPVRLCLLEDGCLRPWAAPADPAAKPTALTWRRSTLRLPLARFKHFCPQDDAEKDAHEKAIDEWNKGRDPAEAVILRPIAPDLYEAKVAVQVGNDQIQHHRIHYDRALGWRAAPEP
ncbi:MAG: CRISPR-associated helicase Cas3' [Rhodospirillales bacterium]|nr:CRISPR-associated helicase Cas3' [Rhodospirillales bacterium]